MAMNEADAAAGATLVLSSRRNGGQSAGDMQPPASSSSSSSSSSSAAKRNTKRHRRSAKNEKHAWPQHPKIQNADQREQAYLRAAGLTETTHKKGNAGGKTTTDNTLLILDPKQLELDQQQHNFARQLGSADARTRHRTVLQLRQYLAARCGGGGVTRSTTSSSSTVVDPNSVPGLSELELLKLWKCLWFTLYMADRVPVQAELAKQMASLLWSLVGTEEEDEYAASQYVELMEDMEDEEDDMEDDEDERGEDEGDDDQEDDDGDQDEDDEVILEEIENTLTNHAESDGDDSEESLVDFEERQMSILQEHDTATEFNRSSSWEVDGLDEGGSDDDDGGDEQELDDEQDLPVSNDMDVGHCRGAHLAALFVRTFFQTVVREWGNMDKYRIDKFYTLIREIMSVVYTYIAKRNWSIGLIRLFNDAIYDECLSKTPNGVRYHVIDVCMEELSKAATGETSSDGVVGLPLTEATMVDVLEPFFAMAQTGSGGDDTIHLRVVENILEKFLTHFSLFSENHVQFIRQKKNKSGSILPMPDTMLEHVHVGTISQFIFDVAADENIVKEEYRKNLYDVHKKYERRIYEIGKEHDVDLDEGMGCCGNEDCTILNCVDSNCETDETNIGEEDYIDEVRGTTNNIEELENIEKTNASNCCSSISKTSSSTRHQNGSADKDTTGKKTAEKHAEPTKTGGNATHVEVATNDTKVEIEANTNAVLSKKAKKRKRKKERSNSVDNLEKPALEEEVITITVADQKAATQKKPRDDLVDTIPIDSSVDVKKRKNGASQKKEETESEARKRVKFDKVNKARSYKTSMQRLRDTSLSLNLTPEKSILLQKKAHSESKMKTTSSSSSRAGKGRHSLKF